MEGEGVELKNFGTAEEKRENENFCPEISNCRNIVHCSGNSVESSDCKSFQDMGNLINCESLLRILSGLYAEILMIIAGISLFTELLHGTVPLFHIHVYFFIYILAMGIIFSTGYFANKFFKRANANDVTLTQYVLQNSLDSKLSNCVILPLKIGILIFGLLALISCCLWSAAVFIAPQKCLNVVSSSVPVLLGIFVVLQTTLIMVNPKQIFRVFGCLRDFAVMHLLATNAILWLRMFMWESAKDWQDALHLKYNSSTKFDDNEISFTLHALEINTQLQNGSQKSLSHVVHTTSHCWWRPEFKMDNDILAIQICLQNSEIGLLWEKTTQFLYPFLTQYYLTVVCFLYMMSKNLKSKFMQSDCVCFIENFDRQDTCRHSTKGLFLGSLILLSSIIITIIYFTVEKNSSVLLSSAYCVIFTSSVIAAIMGFNQIKTLSAKNICYDRQIMKMFQGIGTLAVHIYGTCSLFAGVFISLKFVLSLEAVLMIIHAGIQYMLIIHVSGKVLVQSRADVKPARQAIVFLLLCNISLWLLDTVVTWNQVSQPHLQVYGVIAWPIITRFLLPFVALHRFYSATLLFQVWRIFYQ